MPVSRRVKLFLLWPLLVLAIIGAALRIALGTITEYAITDWFAQQGIESEIDDVSFRLLQGEMQLQGLSAGSPANPLLEVGELNLDWRWAPLLDDRIRIVEISLSDLFVDIERDEDNTLVIAGVGLGGDSAAETATADAAGAEPPAWTIDFGNFEIENFKHCYRAPPTQDYCGGFDRLAWDGELALDLSRLNEAFLPLDLDGSFEIEQLALRNNLLERSLVEFDRFALDNVRIEGLGQVSIETIEVEALDLLERETKADRPRVSRLETLRVSQLGLQDLQRLEIDAIEISEHEVTVVKLEQGALEVMAWLPEPATEEPATETVSEESAEDPAPAEDAAEGFSFALNQLTYATERSLRYEDRSLKRPFLVDLNAIRFKIEGLDSKTPDQPSRIEYSARYAAHGTIDINGTATPLAERPSIEAEGVIDGLDLRDLSPFTVDTIGHQIRSGELDAQLGIRAEEAILDSVVDLTLNHFTLTAINAEEAQELDAAMGFPVNASLSLLKDRNNRIKLEIPITGNLTNPDFDPGDAITQATTTAVTAAILNYYTPFGLITLADGLFSLATALKFEPVVYAEGSAELSATETDQLDKIAALMSERPGVAVTLCGHTNTVDRIALFEDTAETPADELELTGEQLAALRQLGETRIAAVENYLVEKEIDDSRLVLCNAEHAEGEGLGGVEISI